MDKKSLLELAIYASIEAGKQILDVYDSDFAVEHKDDKSPLTLADKKAHLAIVAALEKTGIPVLSEEGKTIAYAERKAWNSLWIVDPLDGTKEFVKRNGEFTVNIALVENQVPVMGIIYVPVLKTLYFGEKSLGAFKLESVSVDTKLPGIDALIASSVSLPQPNPTGKFSAVASRSHMSPETEAFINDLRREHGDIEIVSKGSSLKICLIADGTAQVYPRFAPTMEWDTAAGHAIVSASGGKMVLTDKDEALKYNKENLLNPWFIVKR